MKKELTAIGLLLLLLLSAFLNVRHIDNLIEGVQARLTCSESAAEREDAEEALTALAGALELWESHRGYTGVFLSHRDLDSLYDAFSQLEEKLRQEDFQAAAAGYSRLRYYLQDLSSLEHLSFGSVL